MANHPTPSPTGPSPAIVWLRVEAALREAGIGQRTKVSAAWARAVGWFAPAFTERFATYLGGVIWWPRRRLTVEERTHMALHELVHHGDRTRLGLLAFITLYTFPQCLAILALGALLAPVWPGALWALLALVFALPWPSPGRTWLELRGYAMTLQAQVWQGYPLPTTAPLWLLAEFTGSAYFFMWPFPGGVRRRVQRYIDAIRDDRLDALIPEVTAGRRHFYREVHDGSEP